MPSAVLDADQLYREGAGVVVLDNFLNVEALTELHQYLLESTIWHAPKIRYLGAYWHEGLHHPILMKLGRELRELYPFYRREPFKRRQCALAGLGLQLQQL